MAKKFQVVVDRAVTTWVRLEVEANGPEEARALVANAIEMGTLDEFEVLEEDEHGIIDSETVGSVEPL
jgi:hypothetical protein